MFLVETFFYHLAGENLLADLDIQLGVELGIAAVDERHAHALVG